MQTYLSLAKGLNTPLNSEKEFFARKWLKDNEKLPLYANKLQAHPIRITALYKCMSERCPFITNNPNKMTDHLLDHQKMISILKYNKGLDKKLVESDKRIRSCVYGWRHCAYCNHQSHDPEDLVQHIKNVHGTSIFQCSKCYYRAIDIGLFQHHFEKFHPGVNDKKIFLCNHSPNISIDDVYNELCAKRDKFVKKYTCTNGKKDKTLIQSTK